MVKPFLRWAGGKSRIVKRLLNYLPEDLRGRTYQEPFLGAGSLFLLLKPRQAVLSDANKHLMACYRFVRDEPEKVHEYLMRHAKRVSRSYYNAVRHGYNGAGESAEQAARFIFLNKTCFNGIFRVNKKGVFNVPFGKHQYPTLPGREQLAAVSAALRDAELRACAFEEATDNAAAKDFFYLDPPYPPLNGTSYFTHYTSEQFGEEDQRRLAESVRTIDQRGAKFLMTNADTQWIRHLYKEFHIDHLSVFRCITCKAKRYRVNELIITNYKPMVLGGGA